LKYIHSFNYLVSHLIITPFFPLTYAANDDVHRFAGGFRTAVSRWLQRIITTNLRFAPRKYGAWIAKYEHPWKLNCGLELASSPQQKQLTSEKINSVPNWCVNDINSFCFVPLQVRSSALSLLFSESRT